MNKNKLKSPAIYINATIALMYIQFLHKFVVEVYGAMSLKAALGNIPTTETTIALGILYLAAIILCFFRSKWGLIIGIALGIHIILQAVIIHLILGIPKEPIYYPVFSISQGVLIIYFAVLILKNEQKLADKQKPMSSVAFKIMTIIMNKKRKPAI